MLGDTIYCINKKVARKDVEGITIIAVTVDDAPYLYVYLSLKDEEDVNYFNCIGALTGKGYDLRQDNVDRLYEEFKDLDRKTFISATISTKENHIALDMTDEYSGGKTETGVDIPYSDILDVFKSDTDTGNSLKEILAEIYSVSVNTLYTMFQDNYEKILGEIRKYVAGIV